MPMFEQSEELKPYIPPRQYLIIFPGTCLAVGIVFISMFIKRTNRKIEEEKAKKQKQA